MDTCGTANRKTQDKGPAYFHCPGQFPLQPITTGQLLDSAALQWPAREAVVSPQEGLCLTFLQVKDQADRLGAGLLKLGLKSGDRIALVGLNTVHWYISLLAAAKVGLIVVMVNSAYRAEELGTALKQVSARAVISHHRFKSQDYYQMLASLEPRMSSAAHGRPLASSVLPEMSFVIVATEEALPGAYRWKDILELTTDKEGVNAVQRRIQPDDPAYILFSSGSTGIPKPAVLSHFGTVNNAINAARRMGYHKKHVRVCQQLPMFHVFGFSSGVLASLAFGATLVLPAARFNVDSTIAALQKYKIDIMLGTPTIYLDVCNQIKALLPTTPKIREACSSVGLLVSGGSACLPELAKKILNTFPSSKLMSGYGMTETSSASFSTLEDDPVEKQMTTIGLLMDHLEVKIVDKDGRMVPFGTAGEACFRGPSVFLEYLGNEAKTKETKSSAGWLKTGDIMILAEDGYASILGRIKDVIIRGGENIFPVEVENFLLQHPEIVNAQVYGVADDRMGEEVAVAVKLTPSSHLTEASLKEYCKGKMAHYKIPRYVRFVSEYPMTSSGKVQKNLLKDIHEKELKENKM